MMKAQSPPQTTAAPATTDHAVAARPPRSWSKELPRSSPLTRTNFPLPRALAPSAQIGQSPTQRTIVDVASSAANQTRSLRRLRVGQSGQPASAPQPTRPR